MNCVKIRFFVLTGDPGVGKTTLVKKISSLFKEKNVETVGFYTEEVRKSRTREGFDVVSLDGQRGRLARDLSLLDTPVKYKVGKYGVLIQEFEKVAMPCLEFKKSQQSYIMVIDEIGKMEFFSDLFKNKIMEIINSSDKIILATIPIRKGDPLIENIRTNSQSKVWMVTRNNRDKIHEDIINEITTALIP